MTEFNENVVRGLVGAATVAWIVFSGYMILTSDKHPDIITPHYVIPSAHKTILLMDSSYSCIEVWR